MRRLIRLTIPILLLLSSIVFGQVEAEGDNLIVPKEIFKQIRIDLNNYESLKETLKQKDLEIQQLGYNIITLDSVISVQIKQIKLLTERVEDLKPTIWQEVQKYGFAVGLVVGVLIAK